jgi:hypothetical protein
MGCTRGVGGLWTHSDNIPADTPVPKEPSELVHSHDGGASFQSVQHVFLCCVFWKLCSTQTNYFIVMNEMNICQ